MALFSFGVDVRKICFSVSNAPDKLRLEIQTTFSGWFNFHG